MLLATVTAVICFSSISFFISSVYGLLDSTEASLIGGDRVISSATPLRAELTDIATNNNLQTSTSISFYSMLTSNDNLALTAIKAVDNNYPLRGQLYIDNQPTSTLPKLGEIWLEERAMLLLGVKLGDIVTLDKTDFKVTHVLTMEPDRVSDGFSFAPRALINLKDLPSTELLQPGSRANYRLLIAGSADLLADFDQAIKFKLTDDEELQVAGQQDSQSNNRLLQMTSFLRLAVLVNIILVSVVIAIVAFNYIYGQMREVAIMRCLGATNTQIISLYTLALLIISIACGALGSASGYGASSILAKILESLMGLQLPAPSLQPAWWGVGLAIFLGLGSGLPPLQILRKLSPTYVLRAITVPSNNWVWFCYWLLASILITVMYYLVANRLLFSYTLLSIIGAVAISAILLQILFHFIPLIIPRMAATWKIALRNIISNSTLNSLQFFAFVIVITIATVLFSVRSDLLASWQAQMPENAPNYFAISIQPEEVSALSSDLAKAGVTPPTFYPVIRGRLEAINQQNANYWRPLNLTWSDNLPIDNKILAGKWLDSTQAEVSVETRIAERIGIKLNDQITFRAGFTDISAKVTSIRSVTWESFNPNFYFIFSPALMKNISTNYMGSFYVAEPSSILPIVREYSSVTFISIKPILDQAILILELVSILVAYLWIFTLIIGLLLLAAVTLVSAKQRNYQNNLMRVLGASKLQLSKILSYELAMLGASAGGIGSMVAVMAARFIAVEVFELAYQINWLTVLLGALAGMSIMLIGGFVTSAKAMRTSPVQLLRNTA